MIHTTIAIASTARIEPTTMGRIGTPDPLLGRTALRAVLPLREPAPAWARDLGAIGRLVEYRRPFLASAESTCAFVRPGPETQRKEVPIAGLRSSLHSPGRP